MKITFLASISLVSILSTLITVNPAVASRMSFNVSGTLEDGGSFSGMFTYDDMNVSDSTPEATRGSFQLIDWMIDVMSPSQNNSFVSSDDIPPPMGVVFATTETDPDVVGLVFGNENNAGLQFFFEYLGSDVNSPPSYPNDFGDFVQMTDPPLGSEQSVYFFEEDGEQQEVKVDSVTITKKALEPSSALSFLALVTLGAASTLKRKPKPLSPQIEN